MEKSELWVYKAKCDEGDGASAGKEDDIEEVKPPPRVLLRDTQRQGSAIDLDIGPKVEAQQAKNYKSLQQVSRCCWLIQMMSDWFLLFILIGYFRACVVCVRGFHRA